MSGADDPRGETLNSWKEIAAFFRKDVRTVQRWEREGGLPVHRDAEGRGRVWARRVELQSWWTRSADVDQEPAREASASKRWRQMPGIWLAVAMLLALVAGAGLPLPTANADVRVAVDVRPFAHPNVIVPGGVLAVALTAPQALLAQLDPSTLRAGGSAPRETRWQDFNADGRPELWLYFDVSTLALPPTARRLAIAGRTRDGRTVAGADDVTVLRR